MPDKKISELDVLSSPITGDDYSVIVHNGTDYKYAFAQILQYISGNLSTGSVVTFISSLPQNTVGNNGDVAVNTNSGSFYQKRNGIWIEVFNIPLNSTTAGSAILYGLGEPNAGDGQENDTYINTANGKFYQKTVNGWNQVFSMLNGPPGGPGPRGVTGAAGINGKSVLNGIINPSNQTVGTDGDFYINTTNYTIFGPKTNGDWGTGAVIIPENFDAKADKTYVDIQDLALKNQLDTGLASSVKQSDIGAGLTLSNNKLTLDLSSKQLVSPVITVQWQLWKTDGTTPYTPSLSTSQNIIVDKGVKADMAAKYKYPAPNTLQALPQTVTGSFGTTLPGSDLFSNVLSVNSIAGNTSYTVNLQKPKSGLLVSGSQVAFASGNDSTSDSCSVTFKGRSFMLYSDKATLTAEDVQDSYNTGSFQDGRARTFTGVTPGVGKYFYYIYDASFNPFTAVLYNDAEAYFGAFQFQSGGLTIVNNAGINQNLIVARSNATNAFNNSKLAFS